MVTEIELFQSPDLTLSDFCLWGWMRCGVYKRQVNTADELLTRILDAAACIKIMKISLDEQHVIFVHVLQSAFR
jgi:hypothetical protein